MAEKQPETFMWVAYSNSVPVDAEWGERDWGYTQSNDPMAALEEVVRNYRDPLGLFMAEIRATPIQKTVARYLSARAATKLDAIKSGILGFYEWKDDGLYVDGKKLAEKPQRYERF